MYQGLTLAFDFSVEEIWTSFLTGATLVPKPAGVSLVGEDLHDFLIERRVTAMCVVPTLLATVEADLDDLRFLLVSGEACPQDLIRRWWTPQRRFLNVYGPTEATVTATMAQVHPDRPVTIGRPLPTYAALVLDTTDPTRVLPFGETGELAVAGVGLADGYLNRDEKTAEVFVPAPVDLPNNPSGLIYRTGDLTRINADGDVVMMPMELNRAAGFVMFGSQRWAAATVDADRDGRVTAVHVWLNPAKLERLVASLPWAAGYPAPADGAGRFRHRGGSPVIP